MYRIPMLAVLALMCCGCSTRPSRVDHSLPLLIAACPEQLPPLTDDSRNALVRKIAEVSEIYHKCRAAALPVEE